MQCPICKNEIFIQTDVLKPRLIKEWGLNSEEVDYINKQQGFQCSRCSSNLRSMTLAGCIMNHFSFQGNFMQFIYSNFRSKLKVLEINTAGGLHPYLKKFANYTFAEYPEIDIQNLPYPDNSFNVIIHSDTLEHVENSQLALKECNRVLMNRGVLFYTIPVIYSRMTKRRDFLENSYHGIQEELQGEDYKVFTEYGADFWVEIIKAGFKNVSVHTLSDLSSLAICAIKQVNIYEHHNDWAFLITSSLNRINKRLKKYFTQRNGIHRRKIFATT